MSEQEAFLVGDASVMRVLDHSLDGLPADTLFPAWSQSHDQTVATVELSVHAWLVRDRGRTILVDTGSGNDKARPFFKQADHLHTPFLERLAAADVTPHAVDFVLLTHLHVDHVGWNTRLIDGSWRPTFPNARYIFARAEHRYFSDPANHNERNRTSFQAQRDSVDPIIAAGLADQIDVDGSEVIEGISFHPTPGHSPFHASVALVSAGRTAFFPGDVMHHPVQVSRPELNLMFDADPERSVASRRWALRFAADRRASVFTSHFIGTSAGWVERVGTSFAWRTGVSAPSHADDFAE